MAARRRRRDPQLIGEIVPKLLKKLGIATGRQRLIQDTWREVAGDQLAESTRVAALRSGVLTVEVLHAPVLHELSVYHKKDFLKLLRERLPVALTDLKFKMASQKGHDIFVDRRAEDQRSS